MMNLEVFKGQSCLQNRWISRVLWFLSSSRNASVLIFSCLAAYLLEINGLNQLTLSGIPRKTTFFLFSFFLFFFLFILCVDKKSGESCIVASLQPPSFYFISLFSSVALFIFSLSLICFVIRPISSFCLTFSIETGFAAANHLTMVICAE